LVQRSENNILSAIARCDGYWEVYG